MKYLLLTLLFFGCTTPKEKLNIQSVLQKSIAIHDPNNNWATSTIKLHIQEPRISNPHRYSIITMNNEDDSFELIRNRDSTFSKHTIDNKGHSTTLLNTQTITDRVLIKKYRLQPERNIFYQKFYQHLIGVPMSLNANTVEQYGSISKEKFNNKDSFKLAITLKEKIISNHWNVFIDQNNFTVLGIEIIHPNDVTKRERLYFEGSILINTIRLPRVRHWHEFDTNDYSGSDVIVKELSSFKY